MSTPAPSHTVPPRLLRYVALVSLACAPVAAGAAAAIHAAPPAAGLLAGVLAFAAAAFLAELKPVPLDEEGGRSVSLAFVFLLAACLLFGWAYGVLAAIVAMGAVQLLERQPAIRTVFNSATYGLSAFVAGLPELLFGLRPATAQPVDYEVLTAIALAGGAAYVTLNVILVCGAMALHAGTRLAPLLDEQLRASGPPFAIMAFMSALAASLWTVQPTLEVLLAGPLFALALYQRYAYRHRVAARDAETDALTGLGNHRAFQARLRDELTTAEGTGEPVALCLIDIDDFKGINDRYGHPVGDAVLGALAAEMRARVGDGIAYRVGGEEFALVLRGASARAASATLAQLQSALALATFAHEEPVTVSAGIATHPDLAGDRETLLAHADRALYRAKRDGKNRACVFDAAALGPTGTDDPARAARMAAAEALIRAVDAKDTYTGEHSHAVSRLAAGIAEAMGLPSETVEQVRLAGLLHDLGKIGVPDAVLRKPTALDAEELAIMREHPLVGYRLLQGLGVSPVDRWVLHHHERWDGSGYPDGLAGEATPLGSRVILVADAFDAMTSDRTYSGAMTTAAALAELRRRCWTQFDARVVAGLERHLATPGAGAERDAA